MDIFKEEKMDESRLLYRITPVDKKSITFVYDVFKIDEEGNARGFVVRELYRWGQGFRKLDEPIYLENKWIICDPNLGWGAELDDGIATDFEFEDGFTDEEKAEIEEHWMNGDPNDPDCRVSGAWLYDWSDWEIEENYIEILGPFKVDIIDKDQYNVVIEENIELQPRPKQGQTI